MSKDPSRASGRTGGGGPVPTSVTPAEAGVYAPAVPALALYLTNNAFIKIALGSHANLPCVPLPVRRVPLSVPRLPPVHSPPTPKDPLPFDHPEALEGPELVEGERTGGGRSPIPTSRSPSPPPSDHPEALEGPEGTRRTWACRRRTEGDPAQCGLTERLRRRALRQAQDRAGHSGSVL